MVSLGVFEHIAHGSWCKMRLREDMGKRLNHRVRWYKSFVVRFSVINMLVVIALVAGVIYRSHQRDREQLVERFSGPIWDPQTNPKCVEL